jgi:MFS transporter, ACS family, D-galactonate transporter
VGGALGLMVISGLLNYVDRANVSMGSVEIQRELHLSNLQFGVLLSAFFWTYALAQLFYAAGWLADRMNVCWVLAGGVAVWSFATGACGVAGSLAAMFAFRLILGAGESVAYPSYSRILVNCFPERHRGFSNAAIDAGTKAGPAVGALLGGWLIPSLGWRAFFIVLSVAGALWVIAWLKWMPRSRHLSATRTETVAFRRLFLQRDLWWTSLGLFCSNYFWYFLITWLPPYLEQERRFPKRRMAAVSAAAYFTIAISSVVSGWLSDRWIARGAPVTRVRKTFAGCGLGLSTVLVGVQVTVDPRIAIGILLFASAAFGLYTSNVFAISQALAGGAAAGRWTSIQNGIGNLAGVAAPWFTGWVTDHSGTFFLAFLVAAAMALVSGAAYVFGVGRIAPVKFETA